MGKTFFSFERAVTFASYLKRMGYSPIVWEDMDGFGQRIYIVKWKEVE